MTKITGPFIQGPICLLWMAKAAKEGKSKGPTVVGLLCWYVYFLKKKQQPFHIQTKFLRVFGMERHSCYNALNRLEELGLIKKESKRGASPKIWIIGTELVK